MANSIEVILNARAGSQDTQKPREVLEKVFGGSGRSFGICVASGEEIDRVVNQKVQSDCEVLVAGGGDGTVCAVAKAAQKNNKTIGVLPLGTFNYFANNLGIPHNVEEAARVILDGNTVCASVLDLDGRLILNNTSIGIHPAVLLRRRKLYRRWGRNQLNAYLSVLLTAFQPPPRIRVRLASDNGEVIRETPLVLICSNAFQIETFRLIGKECLADGKFAVYIAHMADRATIFGLGLRTAFRRLRPEIDYEVICGSDVKIESLRDRHFQAAVDGELERLESPLRFRIAPDKVRVLAPRKNLAVG
jgi:diacylglycerol kinase family enzyme